MDWKFAAAVPWKAKTGATFRSLNKNEESIQIPKRERENKGDPFTTIEAESATSFSVRPTCA
jgi:hypothetical protein